MRIVIRKNSSERHVLEVVRANGLREQVECETRSYLTHDFLHYAVESEARVQSGFWGNLASGRTLADMNDRTGKSMAAAAPDLMVIEQIVGALSSVVKGSPAARVVDGLRDYARAQGTTMPAWLTEEFVVAVNERMRQLMGRWKATRYGDAMELEWPA